MHKTKQDRQQEAIERMLTRDNRSDERQLEIIRQRPGRSFQETIKLWGRITVTREA